MNKWHYWCDTNVNPALRIQQKLAAFLVFIFRSSFLRKVWLCPVCRGVNIHLYVPANNFCNHWTISKRQMGSCHRGQISFRKGLDKGEREPLPHHQGRRQRCEHSPSHPDARHKARVPPPPRSQGLSMQSGGFEDTHCLLPPWIIADEHPKCFFVPETEGICAIKILQEQELIFTSEREGTRLYWKLPGDSSRHSTASCVTDKDKQQVPGHFQQYPAAATCSYKVEG